MPQSSCSMALIAERFGGLVKFGEYVYPGDVKGQRRAREWVSAGCVPAWYFDTVVEAAKRAGIIVTHAELSACAREARRGRAA